MYSNIARKHGNITVKNFQKNKILKYKQNKLKPENDFNDTTWRVSEISYFIHSFHYNTPCVNTFCNKYAINICPR